jgi:hypothetical protein
MDTQRPWIVLLIAGFQLAACTCEELPVPACVRDRIAALKSQPPATPRATIAAYRYQGRRVYYFPPAGCDDYGTVMDGQCHTVCAPDGGWSGTGDGRCPDFFLQAHPDGVVWTDER